MPELGELFVGAYLRIIKGCHIIQYNARDEAQGAQGELDVLGLDYDRKRLFACEVITHLSGAQYSKATKLILFVWLLSRRGRRALSLWWPSRVSMMTKSWILHA